jgi:hypothetical protein
MREYFKKQIEHGAEEVFFYALANEDESVLSVKGHRGTLDTFPQLEYVRQLTDGTPLFKEFQ